MRRKSAEKRRKEKTAFFRRAAAILLGLALCIQLLPFTGLAAETALTWKTMAPAARQAADGTAVTKTYILEVSSGTRYGDGVADNVSYFILTYLGVDGISRTTVLMPSQDAVSKGFEAAAAVHDQTQRRSDVTSAFNFDIPRLSFRKALGSVQTDQMMFSTPVEIKTIEKIQIFGKKRPNGSSDWACQGMRVYSVNRLYGLEMYGWYSEAGYIDFAGRLICRMEMPAEGVVFKWDNSAGMYTVRLEGGTPGLSLKTVDEPHESQIGNRVVFRIDLADVPGAGFESLAYQHRLGGAVPVKDLFLTETACLVVRYTDVYGCVREVVLPLIINALGQAMEALGQDISIAEYAQQGTSIAVPAMLPDFASVNSVNILTGGIDAWNRANLITHVSLNDGTVLGNRINQAKTDQISYYCAAVYRDVELSVAQDGAGLRYRYVPGEAGPMMVSSATSLEGIPIKAATLTPINFMGYVEGMRLEYTDRLDRYLVTITTDNVTNAGTTGDVTLSFRYVSMKDKELESAEYNVREYAEQFYGCWPGSTEDFAYQYGMRSGGTIQFIIPLQGVKEFSSVSIKLEGNDEWQFSGLTVAMLEKVEQGRPYESRRVEWKTTGAQGLQSYVRYSRELRTKDPCFKVGKVYADGADRPDPSDKNSGWTPGALIQDDDTVHTFDGQSQEVVTKDDVDWGTLRHYMSFTDTQQDLGFTKERVIYQVTVQVAGKTVNPGNDDCGSKNLFYFRLIFEHGNSGCTLANQQVAGDAFRTGSEVQFMIPCSQDYGDVVAVQVIPDSQDSNSDIYDKLQIEYISITRLTSDAVSPTWKATSTSPDGLGWVGIDYRDPGETASISGAEGRTLSELATTYQINETSYSANLLVKITTGSYEGKDPFSGMLGVSFSYFNTEGQVLRTTAMDAVEAMNSYSGRTGVKERTVDLDGTVATETTNLYVSNPSYQFRAGTTDSFLITVEDVSQLASMNMLVYSSVATTWTITDVNVYQVRGSGIRYLNANGEYAYRYAEGEDPERVAWWTLDTLSTPLGIYRVKQEDGIATISFALDGNQISMSQGAGQWSTAIKREPMSRDDTLNLFLYPTTAGGASDPQDYNVKAAVRYQNVETLQAMQVSTGRMTLGTDADGNSVFYALGLTAGNLGGISGVDWDAETMRSVYPSVDRAIIQHIRGGVLIGTYVLTGAGNTLFMDTYNTAVPFTTQRVLLQVGEDVRTQELKAEVNDMAACLYFRSKDPGNKELRSRYIYLTDQGYKMIRAGQLLELDFTLGNLEELTGISLITVGNLSLTLRGAYLADEAADGTINGSWSIASPMTPTNRPTRYGFGGDVKVLTLQFDTAEDEEGVPAGTKSPVAMTMGYHSFMGSAETQSFEDIRAYVTDGTAFTAGETVTARLLVADVAELRWVELEPRSEQNGTEEVGAASWKLSRLTASVGLNEPAVVRPVDQRIVEGTPLHIGLSDVMLFGDVTVVSTVEGEEDTKTSAFTGQTASVTVDSGGVVNIQVRVSGSDEGFAATLQNVDPDTGEVKRASLDETHGFTGDQLDALAYQLRQSMNNAIYYQEIEAAAAVLAKIDEARNTYGSFDDTAITLQVPKNYTGERMQYRITVYSPEAPEKYFTVDVNVRSEEVLLRTLLDEWQAVRSAGHLYSVSQSGNTDWVPVMYGETLSQRMSSGGSLTVELHPGLAQHTVTPVIRSLDPLIGATGPADLGSNHGFTREQLEEIRTSAEEALQVENVTDAEVRAAKAVLASLETVTSYEGELRLEELDDNGYAVIFDAPRNFSGNTVYYRLIVTDGENGEMLCQIDISLASEQNPVTQSQALLELAVSSGNTVRQNTAAEAAAAAAEAAEAAAAAAAEAGTGGTEPADSQTGGAEEPQPETGGAEEPQPVTGGDESPEEPGGDGNGE